MTFPIWWENHKIPWFQITNQWYKLCIFRGSWKSEQNMGAAAIFSSKSGSCYHVSYPQKSSALSVHVMFLCWKPSIFLVEHIKDTTFLGLIWEGPTGPLLHASCFMNASSIAAKAGPTAHPWHLYIILETPRHRHLFKGVTRNIILNHMTTSAIYI